MKYYEINNKKLPIPSFFQVLNYGGGMGDKTREIVYSNLTKDTPVLLNYYYLNNEIPHMFMSKKFDNISNFNSISDVLNNIRNEMIKIDKNAIDFYIDKTSYFDFNDKILLLDSGASNIVKYLAQKANYDKDKFEELLLIEQDNYYEFANKLKFDIVIGFDLSGKYTFKDNEKNNKKLIDFYDGLDKDNLNFKLLKESIKFLKTKNYYPKILATVHGQTPLLYKKYVKDILDLELNENVKFWGFALGGVASYKSADESWKRSIDPNILKIKYMKDACIPAQASYIVRQLIDDRPIHALGCGGYPNILLNYFLGSTSFDAASPARRVGDGNDLSTAFVFNNNPPKKVGNKEINFSKVMVGVLDSSLNLRNENFDYKQINEFDDNYLLCNCPACNQINNFKELKNLYHAKEQNIEKYYYSRQLMNIHSIWQHRFLCQKIANYNSLEQFINENKLKLFLDLNNLYKLIKKDD